MAVVPWTAMTRNRSKFLAQLAWKNCKQKPSRNFRPFLLRVQGYKGHGESAQLVLSIILTKILYRVTRRVFSKSVTSKLHLLFQKNLAGSLKTLKVTRISAMYTNFLHPPVHSGPSKFSRPKIWNWSLGNTKANKNLVND